MEITTFNLSRPGEEPQEGDWVRDIALTADGEIFSVVEYEFHEAGSP